MLWLILWEVRAGSCMVRRVSIEQSDVYCVETEAKPSAAGQTKELEQNVQRYVHFLFPVCLSKGLTSPFY